MMVGAVSSGVNRFFWRLLLDSRVLDLPMAYNPIFVT